MPQMNGYIGRGPGDSAVTKARQVFNVTGSTSTFTFASGYDVGYFEVYINGVKLVVNNDYTAGDGTTFTLTSAASNGDVIEAIAYKAFNLANINEFDTASGDFNVTDDLTVGGDAIITGDLNVTGSITGPGVGTENVSTNSLFVVGVSTFNNGVTTFTSGGVHVTGVVTATSFSGSGSNLTGITSIIQGNTTAKVVDTGSDGIFVVETEGSEALRITSNGDVGIGTTNPNSEVLIGNDKRLAVGVLTARNVFGTNVEGSSGIFQSLSAGTGGGGTGFHIDGSAPNNSLQVDNQGNVGVNTGFARQKLHVDEGSLIVTGAGASIGIGTINPSAKLHLQGNSDNGDEDVQLIIEDLDDTISSRIPSVMFVGAGDTTGRIRANDSLGFQFHVGVGVTERLRIEPDGTTLLGMNNGTSVPVRIDNDGRVGMGTTNPTEKLHVVGDARVTGILTVGTASVTIDGTNSRIGIESSSPRVAVDVSQATDGIALPVGTQAQRPTGVEGYMRFNSESKALEIYNGTNWVEIISDYFPQGSVILG